MATTRTSIPKLFLFLIIAFLLEYGIIHSLNSRSSVCMVIAFDVHQSRRRHYPPPRSTIHVTEPQPSTIFPETSTPADCGEGSGMFSPMHQNEKQKQKNNHQPKIKSIWETSAPVLVQASSIETFNFETPTVERVQVLLKKADMVDSCSGRKIPNGEPLIARVDLWHGPDSTPQNLAIYLGEEEDNEYYNDGDVEDEEFHSAKFYDENQSSSDTPFSTIIETPQGHNTIAIRNIADTSDLLACVEEEQYKEGYWYTPSSDSFRAAPTVKNGNDGSNTSNDSPLQSVIQRLQATTTPQRIDSSSTSRSSSAAVSSDDENENTVIGSCTVELPDNIASVQVLLQTEYMCPLQARIELELRMKQESDSYRVVKRTIVEVYSEDGMHRPFFAVLETPRRNKKKNGLRGQKGKGEGWARQQQKQDSVNNIEYYTIMRVVNLSSAEFPLFATVEPHLIDPVLEDNEDDMNVGEKNIPVEEDEDEVASGKEQHYQQFTHFGGGSSFDMNSNSTILDAEIL
mmetsp:Transcript_69559/g.77823  ORF Transcript_69559/g.77823 Transcript_69559/m.77823 type:complete len:513 (+) Transcript_69559:48-1586(+)